MQNKSEVFILKKEDIESGDPSELQKDSMELKDQV